MRQHASACLATGLEQSDVYAALLECGGRRESRDPSADDGNLWLSSFCAEQPAKHPQHTSVKNWHLPGNPRSCPGRCRIKHQVWVYVHRGQAHNVVARHWNYKEFGDDSETNVQRRLLAD